MRSTNSAKTAQIDWRDMGRPCKIATFSGFNHNMQPSEYNVYL